MKRVWNRILDWYWGQRRFFQNAWRFREELKNVVDFEADSIMYFLKKHLEHNLKCQENTYKEIGIGRPIEFAKMRRAIEILNHIIESDYKKVVEEKYGLKYEDLSEEYKDIKDFWEKIGKEHKIEGNKRIHKLMILVEGREYVELCEILTGLKCSPIEKHLRNDETGWGVGGWWV